MKNPTSSLLLGMALSILSGFVMAADAPAKSPQAESFLDAITDGKPMTNFRWRYERVEQDGKTDVAEAYTLRSLIGWQTKPFYDVSVAAQFIGVSKFNYDYFDNKNGIANAVMSAKYPTIQDPSMADVNQLFIDYTGIPDTKIRGGRQSVKLDNVRFIGNVEFRQVMQVFDGVAIENKSIPDTEIYLAYFGRVKQTTNKLRPDDTGIAHVTYKLSPTENLTAYAYLYDMNNIAAASDASTKTFGGRADGSHKINDDWKVLYTAEYAKQDHFKGGSSLIDNHYYKVGAGAGYGNWFVRADHELLSGNSNGKAFQTPLGTNHLFQGWADLFLVTPNEGIRDTFVTAGGKIPGAGSAFPGDISLLGEYHWIDSDRKFTSTGGAGTGSNYGREFDLSVAYTYQGLMGKIEYANFNEGDQYTAARKRDTDKLWLTVMYTF